MYTYIYDGSELIHFYEADFARPLSLSLSLIAQSPIPPLLSRTFFPNSSPNLPQFRRRDAGKRGNKFIIRNAVSCSVSVCKYHAKSYQTL